MNRFIKIGLTTPLRRTRSGQLLVRHLERRSQHFDIQQYPAFPMGRDIFSKTMIDLIEGADGKSHPSRTPAPLS